MAARPNSLATVLNWQVQPRWIASSWLKDVLCKNLGETSLSRERSIHRGQEWRSCHNQDSDNGCVALGMETAMRLAQMLAETQSREEQPAFAQDCVDRMAES
jgi:hypothetical protein